MFAAFVSAVKGFVKKTFIHRAVNTVGTEVGFRVATTGVGLAILFYVRRSTEWLAELVDLNIRGLQAVEIAQGGSPTHPTVASV